VRPRAIGTTCGTGGARSEPEGGNEKRKTAMSIGTILLIILILLLLGVLPTWPHSRGWGYYPSGGIGLILIIIIVLLLLGRL
jgi:hypothetical protein